MTNELTTNNSIFSIEHEDPNQRSRLLSFSRWMQENSINWMEADLGAYRDYLLRKRRLAPSSVKNHLSTVRERYRDIIEDNEILNVLEVHASLALQEANFTPDPANVQASVNRWVDRIKNNISPRKVRVKVKKIAAEEDTRFIRLTEDQISRYLAQIPRNDLMGYRDAAAIALAYCWGLREAEVVDVKVSDMDSLYKGRSALLVRSGKGDKQRMVITEPGYPLLFYIYDWLEAAGITEGYVLRSLGKGRTPGKSLSVDTVQLTLAKYSIDGLQPRPHDLRRSYARNLYLAGWTIEAIAEQLGHDSTQTTLKYIGAIR